MQCRHCTIHIQYPLRMGSLHFYTELPRHIYYTGILITSDGAFPIYPTQYQNTTRNAGINNETGYRHLRRKTQAPSNTHPPPRCLNVVIFYCVDLNGCCRIF